VNVQSKSLLSNLGEDGRGSFTGEQTDPNGLTYLRARYYSSDVGRFLSRDTWGGDYNNPLSLNRWNYTNANPVNYIDPSGHQPIPPTTAGRILNCIVFSVIVPDPGALEALCVLATGTIIIVTLVGTDPQMIDSIVVGCEEVVNQIINNLRPQVTLPQAILSKEAGGAGEAARHLSMLMGGITIAGFGGHPGDPDPDRRDANKNATGLRNILRDFLKNVEKSGKSVTDFLKSNGWTQNEIDDFYFWLDQYINETLETDVIYNNVGVNVASDLRVLRELLILWR